jgi:MoaA/NifB/PqqE/SkfB family radical SAM enzyme
MIPDKKTFCIAPYKHADVDPQGFLRICCVSREKSKYRFNEIEEWHKSDILKNLRKNLSSGIKDPICQHCWDKEAHGAKSQRSVYNKHVGKIIETLWDKNFISNLKLSEAIDNVSTSHIQSFDLKLGNLCNLKCIMCNPSSSSQILAEIKLHPELKKLYNAVPTGDLDYASKEEFKSWCQRYLNNSIHLKFTGGEPFLNPYLLQVLDHIPDLQKKKCILHFTTNLTRVNEAILNLLGKFKETWISVSVEGIGDLLEYARYPHKWSDLENNLKLIMGRDKVFVSISHVIQAPTFVGMKDLVSYFDGIELKLDPIFLESPSCFRLCSIKPSVKEQFISDMQTYRGFNHSFVHSVVNFVESNLQYDKKSAIECVERLSALDRVRGTKFHNVSAIDLFK